MAFIVEDKHVRYRDIANIFPIRDELLWVTQSAHVLDVVKVCLNVTVVVNTL